MSVSSLSDNSALRLSEAANTGILTIQAAAKQADNAAKASAEAALKASGGGDSDAVAIDKGMAAAKGTGDPALTSPSVTPSVLSQLVAFIPTETLTLYVAVEAALGDVVVPDGKPVCSADFMSRWAWLWGLTVLTAALAIGLSYRKQRSLGGSKSEFKFPMIETFAAAAAFVVWGLALPSTPLRDSCGYNYSSWSPVLLLGGTIVIAASLYIVGKEVSWEKVMKQ